MGQSIPSRERERVCVCVAYQYSKQIVRSVFDGSVTSVLAQVQAIDWKVDKLAILCQMRPAIEALELYHNDRWHGPKVHSLGHDIVGLSATGTHQLTGQTLLFGKEIEALLQRNRLLLQLLVCLHTLMRKRILHDESRFSTEASKQNTPHTIPWPWLNRMRLQ
jgi:hypothetical protein